MKRLVVSLPAFLAVWLVGCAPAAIALPTLDVPHSTPQLSASQPAPASQPASAPARAGYDCGENQTLRKVVVAMPTVMSVLADDDPMKIRQGLVSLSHEIGFAGVLCTVSAIAVDLQAIHDAPPAGLPPVQQAILDHAQYLISRAPAYHW